LSRRRTEEDEDEQDRIGTPFQASSRSWHETVTQVSADVRTGVLWCSLQILLVLQDAVLQDAVEDPLGVVQV
jgi:hypothetical protein